MAGFEGELRSNPQQLDRAIQSLQEELRRAGHSERLSPQAQLELPPPPQQLPGYLTKIPLVIGVVFVFFLAVFLFGVLALQASLIADDMRTLQNDIAEEQ